VQLMWQRLLYLWMRCRRRRSTWATR